MPARIGRSARRPPRTARTVLKSPALAHLVTLNPDGSPQVTVVWAGLDGDEIVAAHLAEHRKFRNIRNDSRVALSVETGTRNAMGLTEYLVVYEYRPRYRRRSRQPASGARAHLPRPRRAIPADG
jgi:hypothetical protein